LKSQKRTEDLNKVYMLAATVFSCQGSWREISRGGRFGDGELARVPEVHQYSGWAWDGFLLLSDFSARPVCIVDRTREILTSGVWCSPALVGWNSRQNLLLRPDKTSLPDGKTIAVAVSNRLVFHSKLSFSEMR